MCDCPGEDLRVMGGKGYCPGWQDFTSTVHGVCRDRADNGERCLHGEQCKSGYCADGKFCAPDGTGKAGDYCHHDDHCSSGMCDCPGEDLRVMGGKGYCPGWQDFTTTVHGVCLDLFQNGERCRRGEQCKSTYCADGRLCAPVDGTGAAGEYCHHNNHCKSGACVCPKGTGWWGFCNGWKEFNPDYHGTCTAP